jgi:SAM-dependent methyltransferase
LINKIEFSARNLTSNAGLLLLLEHASKNGIFDLIDHDLVFENASTNKIKMNHIQTHWDMVAEKLESWKGWGGYYQARIRKIYKFNIPEDQRVLEIGCGSGDLLSSLKPAYGLGLDISPMRQFAGGFFNSTIGQSIFDSC